MVIFVNNVSLQIEYKNLFTEKSGVKQLKLQCILNKPQKSINN